MRSCIAVVWLAALLSGSALAEDGTAEEKPGPTFDVLEYRVEGNTVLPPLIIERAVYPFLGPGRTANDVDAAREALEKAYQTAGFLTVVVEIPKQEVVGGVVTLEVVEATVDRLSVRGNRSFSGQVLKRRLPSLAEGGVPYFPGAQTELAAATRSPDARVTPVLRPGRTPGRVDLDLTVKDQTPLHGSIEFNNKRSPDTSTGRLEASVRYDNLWQRQHSAGVFYVVSPQDPSEVQVMSGSYGMPYGTKGGLISGYYARSDSDLVTAVDSGVFAKGNVVGGRISSPLPTRGGWSHTLSAGADYKDFKQSISLLSGSAVVQQPIRYTAWQIQYGAYGAGRKGDWRVATGVTFGLGPLNEAIVDCNGFQVEQFTCRRAGAGPNFFHWRGDVARTQALPRQYVGYAQIAFQRASQPLITNEQFLSGGVDTVRGYLEAETAGDFGVRGRLELRSPATPFRWSGGGELRGLVFYDIAELGLKDVPSGQRDTFRLSSAGVGLISRANSGLRADVSLAFTLVDGPRTPAGQSRLLARVAYDF